MPSLHSNPQAGEAQQRDLDCVLRASATLEAALAQVREALAGRGRFGSAELRAVRLDMGGVAPLLKPCSAPFAPRAQAPEIAAALQIYARHLRAFQGQLDRLRCMLLARCAALRARRNHLHSVERWSEAWRQTL